MHLPLVKNGTNLSQRKCAVNTTLYNPRQPKMSMYTKYKQRARMLQGRASLEPSNQGSAPPLLTQTAKDST